MANLVWTFDQGIGFDVAFSGSIPRVQLDGVLSPVVGAPFTTMRHIFGATAGFRVKPGQLLANDPRPQQHACDVSVFWTDPLQPTADATILSAMMQPTTLQAIPRINTFQQNQIDSWGTHWVHQDVSGRRLWTTAQVNFSVVFEWRHVAFDRNTLDPAHDYAVDTIFGAFFTMRTLVQKD